MKRKKLVLAMAIAAVLAVVGTGAAAARDPQEAADPDYVNTGGGAEGGPVVRTAAEQVLYDQKRKLADEYAAVRAGTLGYATFKADHDAFQAKTGAASSPSQAAATSSDRVLAVTQKPQWRSYYCGPATAVEILNYLDDHGYDVYGPDGESLTQGHVAAKCQTGYLCTNKLTETPWYYYSGYPHPMKSTINQWAGSSWYVVENDPERYWVGDLLIDTDSGYPIASNVNEWANTGYHLVGHPHDRNIGHWVAAHGYKNNGNTTRYADSVHGTDFWPWADNVPAHSDIQSYKFIWLMSNNSKGYVW